MHNLPESIQAIQRELSLLGQGSGVINPYSLSISDATWILMRMQGQRTMSIVELGEAKILLAKYLDE